MAKTQTENALEAAAEMIVHGIGGGVTDPVARAMLFEKAQPEARRVIAAAIATARAEAVKEARATRTIADLASEMGVTPARVYQIMNNAD